MNPLLKNKKRKKNTEKYGKIASNLSKKYNTNKNTY